MKTGKIRIKDKVYFEPDGLPKPIYDDICKKYNDLGVKFHNRLWRVEMKEYEASKQLIEVSNVSNLCKNDIIKNSSCKAEIIENKATIVELIKE